MSNISLRQVLASLMKQFNLNALELERHTGVPASTTYRLLKSNDGNPTVEVLKKLSSFFQITVSQLIGEEPIGIKQIPLIPSLEIATFLKASTKENSKYQSISIDFPLSAKSFATYAQDDFMEPFILANSIVIIDPEKETTHKDFVLYIKNHSSSPQIRQIIRDGSDLYLKALHSNYPINIIKIKKTNNYAFIGTIVHYRTNLFSFDTDQVNPHFYQNITLVNGK